MLNSKVGSIRCARTKVTFVETALRIQEAKRKEEADAQERECAAEKARVKKQKKAAKRKVSLRWRETVLMCCAILGCRDKCIALFWRRGVKDRLRLLLV